MRLKIGLKRVNNIVFGRVLEQDEALRDKSYKMATCGSIICHISSFDNPQLHDDTLFIRGTRRSHDDIWFARCFAAEKYAVQAVKDIKMLVAEINLPGAEQESPNDCGLDIIE